MENFENEIFKDAKQAKYYWQCKECEYVRMTKPMPADREKFYQYVQKNSYPKCPRCESRSFIPVGF